MSFSRYPAHKASGVEWIGEVPSGWVVQPLRRHARLLTEKTDRRDHPVALENIESWTGRFLPTDTEFQGDGVAFERGDILFGKLRPYLAKTLVATASGEAVGDFLVMQPTEAANSWFLSYLLRSSEVISIIDGSTFGSKMPRASWDFVGAMPTPLPPPQEQQAIVSFLDRETAKIDALVAEQQRLIELLKEKRQAVIAQAVTKGMDPNVPMKDSGVEWLGKMPAHWKVLRVKDVARLESGHTPSKTVPEYWENCAIPWVSLNDSKQLAVSDYITETAIQINELGLANSSARMLPAGAVVFTRDATIGLAAITTRPMAVSQHLIAWCPSEDIDALYLLRVFDVMKRFLDSTTFGATIKTIGMADVKKLVTPVPPLEEQLRITAAVGRDLDGIYALVHDAELSVDLLRERRAALISAAVTGKIDVRNYLTEGA